MIYTLSYIIISVCFVLKTTEFVSNGLTIENLFRTVIPKEYDDFIMHHILRTSFSVVVYSSLPLGLFKTPLLPIFYIIKNLDILDLYWCYILIMFLFIFISVYLLGTLLVNDSEREFVHVYFNELCFLFLVPLSFFCSVVISWRSHGWNNHPLVIDLRCYDSAHWTIPAYNISTEFRS